MTDGAELCVGSVLGLQVTPDARRGILVDVLTVYGQGGKSIVFCERKRDADEVAAGVALAMPCEVSHQSIIQLSRSRQMALGGEGSVTVTSWQMR